MTHEEGYELDDRLERFAATHNAPRIFGAFDSKNPPCFHLMEYWQWPC